jgi:hypothetical protein
VQRCSFGKPNQPSRRLLADLSRIFGSSPNNG